MQTCTTTTCNDMKWYEISCRVFFLMMCHHMNPKLSLLLMVITACSSYHLTCSIPPGNSNEVSLTKYIIPQVSTKWLCSLCSVCLLSLSIALYKQDVHVATGTVWWRNATPPTTKYVCMCNWLMFNHERFCSFRHIWYPESHSIYTQRWIKCMSIYCWL